MTIRGMTSSESSIILQLMRKSEIRCVFDLSKFNNILLVDWHYGDGRTQLAINYGIQFIQVLSSRNYRCAIKSSEIFCFMRMTYLIFPSFTQEDRLLLTIKIGPVLATAFLIFIKSPRIKCLVLRIVNCSIKWTQGLLFTVSNFKHFRENSFLQHFISSISFINSLTAHI